MSTQGSEDSVPISEKVRFWEEQDKINKVLIPRVIRQHELLTRHIGKHESLPEVVANAVHNAVSAVREEQKREFDAEVTRIAAAMDARVEAVIQKAAVEAERKAQGTRRFLVGLTFGSIAIAVAALVISAFTFVGR